MRDPGNHWRPDGLVAHEARDKQQGFWWLHVLIHKLRLQRYVGFSEDRLNKRNTHFPRLSR